MKLMEKKTHLTDLLLLLVLGLAIVFISFIPLYGEKIAPFFFNSSLYTISFTALIALLGTYFFYEVRYNKNKINKVFAGLFLLLVIENLIVVICAPNEYWITTTIKYSHDISNDYRAIEIFQQSGYQIIPTYLTEGEQYKVLVDLSGEYKGFSSLAVFGELLAIYLVIFVIPKKFNSKKMITYLTIAVFAVGIIAILYSYIAEGYLYVEFFKNLFVNHQLGGTEKAIQSFTGQHNVYGMLLLMVLFFAMINHAINKKWWNYLIMGFTIINLVFSTSKGSLITAAIMIIGYLIMRLVLTFKAHFKRNLSISIVLGIGIIVALAILLKTGKMISIFDSFIKSDTIVTRIHIWENTVQLLNESNGWIFGRGFVLLLRMLYPMNALNGDPVIVPHNGVLRLIGLGGIPMLLVFIALVVYLVKITIHDFKKSPSIAITCLISAFGFVIYSIIETNHIMILTMFLPILFNHEAEKKDEIQILETKTKNQDMIQTLSYLLIIPAVLTIGTVSPLINTNKIFIAIPLAVIIAYFFGLLIGNYIKNKEGFMPYLRKTGFNLITLLILTAIIVLFSYLSKEDNLVRGLLISLMFYLISIVPYIIFPPLQRKTGLLPYWLNKTDIKMDNFYKRAL